MLVAVEQVTDDVIDHLVDRPPEHLLHGVGLPECGYEGENRSRM